MNETRIANQALEWISENFRLTPGRPSRNWQRTVADDLQWAFMGGLLTDRSPKIAGTVDEEEAFVMLYKSLYDRVWNTPTVWNPYRQGLIKDMEKYPDKNDQISHCIKHPSYKDRLERLPTLKYRRVRSDMSELYKILTNRYDSEVYYHLERQHDSKPEETAAFHYDLRKFLWTKNC